MKRKATLLASLTLTISLFTPTFSQASMVKEEQTEVKQEIKLSENAVYKVAPAIKEKTLLPRDFRYILLNEVEPKIYDSESYQVETVEEFYKAINDIGNTLPSYAFIKSDTFTINQLKEIYRKYKPPIEESINWHNLVSYKLEGGKTMFVLADKSDRHKQYSAKQYKVALDIFSARLAEQVKGETEEESVKNLYDYIYKHFKYNANGTTYMNVSNLATGSMACNGFSRLVHETLGHLNITSEIRAGESHYWNLVTINDVTTTFDVTIDIVLRKPYLTLGNDTETHLKNSLAVQMFSAAYNGPDTVAVESYNFMDDQVFAVKKDSAEEK